MKGQTGKAGDDASKRKDDGAEPSFDENLAALEAIVALLDQQALGLEPALEKYREGVALVKKCQTILTSFQKQVEELSAEDGSTRPYPNDPDVRAPAN
jgi:exodeoxyribonuclease VII small subunit